MIPRPNQIMTATEVQRAHLTRTVADLIAQGVPVEEVMADARDGLTFTLEDTPVTHRRRAA